MGELSGVEVLQVASGIAASYCSKLLGDAGATVTLVEPPGGDPMRSWSVAAQLPPGRTGALFAFLHHGHRSVTEGRLDPAALVAGSDIVLAPPDGPFAARALAEESPDLVVATVTPYGLGGPWAGRPATDLTVQAESGTLACRGVPERPPLRMGGRVVEWVAGAYAAVAATAAQGRQEATGHGDLIDVSLAEVANLTGTLFSGVFYALGGSPPIDPDLPARSVELPSIEPTADGWVGFNTNTRQQFESFCLLIERPDLAGDEWASIATRLARSAEWNGIVRDWTTRRSTAEIVEAASLLRIPVAPVCDGRSVLELDQVRARGIMVDDPTGSFRMPARPWVFAGEAAPAPRPAPDAGAHDAEEVPAPRSRPAASGDVRPPFEGLRVLDLTAWWAGPSSTSLFAALGADVVHVESTRRPDGMRMSGGLFAAARDQWWEYSGFFLHANANKRDLTLDLDTTEGRELCLRLIEQADLVVENFTPRVLESFDLDWDVVHRTNPRAVMVRMPAFGLEGPWRDRPGFAQTMEQVTGLAWVTGFPDDQPRIQRGPCDPNGGLHAALAAMCALRRRERTGAGSLVVAPMFDSALNVAAELVLEWTAYGNLVGRQGNRGPEAAPQGVYACAGRERWLAVAAGTDDQWQALAGVLGRPDLAADPTLAHLEGRRARHDELDELLASWAAALPLEEALARLDSAGVPAAPAVDARTAGTRPQFVARGFWEELDHPVVGRHPVPGLPWRARGVERWFATAAPTLGQHNHEVLGAWLGLGADELAGLEERGVIGTRPQGL